MGSQKNNIGQLILNGKVEETFGVFFIGGMYDKRSRNSSITKLDNTGKGF